MSQNPESPVIFSVEPSLALPGGEVRLHGRSLLASINESTEVLFGDAIATVVFATATQLTVMVPEAASGESVTVTTPQGTASADFTLATLLSENLHPVANPAVDDRG